MTYRTSTTCISVMISTIFCSDCPALKTMTTSIGKERMHLLIFRYITKALQNSYPSRILQNIVQNDVSGMRLFNYLNSSRLLEVVHSNNFDIFVQNMVFGWSTQDQLNWVTFTIERRHFSSKILTGKKSN